MNFKTREGEVWHVPCHASAAVPWPARKQWETVLDPPPSGLNVVAMAQAGSNEFTQLSQSLAGV